MRIPSICTAMLSGTFVLAGVVMAGADPVITVTQAEDSAVFIELASSGRKNIAASNDEVGVVWEEVRNGKATVLTAFKRAGEKRFSAPAALSKGDALNPVITYCGDRFYLSWIEDGVIRVTTRASGEQPVATPPLTHSSDVNELSIGCGNDSALVAYSSRVDNKYAVYAMQIKHDGKKADTGVSVPVAPVEKFRFQTNPGIAFSKGRIVVTWHDRSNGTNLLYATSGETLDKLTDTVQINELIQKSHEWGSGSSAVRNALSVGPKDRLVIVWLDKRASRSGYKVYSAFSHNGGLTWGDNYKVSDEWGDIVPAWTPAIASDGKKNLTVIWMDKREDENALWVSHLAGLSWSQDKEFRGDDTEPHSPSIAYSPDGRAHLTWIQQTDNGTQLVYQESNF
jgi:hypothetical protein